MHSVFETAPAASAIPITFATKATWEAIARGFPAQARQFALANGFAAKPGKCLTLPAADGKIAQVAVRPRGREQQIPRSVQARRVAGPAAARRLSLRQCAARYAARDAGLCARQLSLRPLPQGGCARRQAGAARRRRRRRHHANGGGGAPCPRPHQHAVERHGTGGAGAGRARSCATRFGASFQLHRRRRSDATEFSADPRGRHGVVARAAADRSELGRS